MQSNWPLQPPNKVAVSSQKPGSESESESESESQSHPPSPTPGSPASCHCCPVSPGTFPLAQPEIYPSPAFGAIFFWSHACRCPAKYHASCRPSSPLFFLILPLPLLFILLSPFSFLKLFIHILFFIPFTESRLKCRFAVITKALYIR